MDHAPILLSKLIPPTPTSSYMRRASFTKKMKISERVKLTLLHSGAGYGKSTGLASYFTDGRSNYSWYSITQEDDDILPFLTHLTHSIRRISPNFGHSLKEWETPTMYPKEADLNRWLALFINELCEIAEPTFIVIDDFHIVDHVFQINYMMEKIIEFLPSHIHLIVATRNRPKWSSLNRLKLTSQLSEIAEEDFTFSEEEIMVFFEDYFDKVLSAREAKKIVEMTEGWAIAINLLAMHIMDSKIPLSAVMKPALHELFTYLSEEVFQNMSEREQHWLLSFSIFPVISTQLVIDFFGDEAGDRLLNFSEKHVFIQPFSKEGTYRYHALFQKFLEEKWLSTNRKKFTAMHKEAAYFYKKKHNPGQVVYHAIKSADNGFKGEMVSEMGAALVTSGQFDWLIDTIKELPDEIKDTHYPLHYYEGEAHRYRAYYEKARLAYTACLHLAEKNNDSYFLSRANAGIAHIYLDTIQPGKAKPFLLEAISFAQKSKRVSFHEMEMYKRQFAENLANLGKASDAANWVETEKMDKNILKAGNLDARILLRTGKLTEAQEILSERMVGNFTLPDAHRETDVLLSLIYSMTGQAEQAMVSAAKGIELGKREKSGFVEAVGWIRQGHAKILQDPFDLTGPESDYVQAITRMDELNVSRGKAEPLMGLSILKARQCLYMEAIQYGETGLRETEKVHDGWLSGLIRIGLAIVHFYAGNFMESVKHSKAAKNLFRECGDTYGEMVASFWLMNIHGKTDQSTYFSEEAKHFSTLCIHHKYFFFLTANTLFSPFDMQIIYPLFMRAASENKDHSATQQIAKQLNLQNVTAHPGYTITVQLMGPFKIMLGLDEVEERRWIRDKAKELFVYLLLNRERYISKDEIMRELWDDTHEKSADRDFKVALNALLKVIEPHRRAREPSYFILRKQTMYRLNPRAAIESDLDRFQLFLTSGLAEKSPKMAMEQLLKASSIYNGHLFEEKLELEWIAEERERVQQQYIQLLERLAQTYTRLKEFGKTIFWAEKILRIDYTWEEAYRLLMYANYQLQNRAQSVKWYKKCSDVLEEELDIAPMETTEEMYKIIMNEL
jgi:LuxR family transcriptional regulator, maltose regulon positive regulatory protein